jgi:hypothetical protein
VSKSDPPPPPFIMPGDDPQLDAIVERLRQDSEDGDPLYVDYRKLQLTQQQKLEDGQHGQSAAALTQTKEQASTSTAPVATPNAVEMHSVPPRDLPGTPARRSPRWLWFLALALFAPAITLALGVLWTQLSDPSARAPEANEAASAVVSAGPVAVPMPTAPATAAIEAATAATTTPPSVPPSSAPTAPTSEPDAGAARAPAAPPTGKMRPQPQPQPQPQPPTSSKPQAGPSDNDDPGLN